MIWSPPTRDEGSGDEYQAVEGLDAETVQLKREYEAQVEKKVASDYAHIMWAYAIIWVLFLGYGLYLWSRARRIEEDVSALKKRIGPNSAD